MRSFRKWHLCIRRIICYLIISFQVWPRIIHLCFKVANYYKRTMTPPLLPRENRIYIIEFKLNMYTLKLGFCMINIKHLYLRFFVTLHSFQIIYKNVKQFYFLNYNNTKLCLFVTQDIDFHFREENACVVWPYWVH